MKNGTIKFSVVCYLMWIMALLLVWAIAPSRAVQAAGVRYAKPNAAGAGDCSSWDDACALQTALTGAVSGEQIWVMAGTHVPTTGSDRTAAFQLKSGVAVYGGFAGTETSLSARNPAVNVTILSGEIGALGAADNSYHVVKGGWTDSSAVLDGFTITGGHADDDPSANDGGGMYNFNGSPKLSNLIITGNSAGSGGGIYNEYGRPSLSDVLIVNNSAVIGGGMYNNSCDAALTNVRILLNSASAGWGGGVYNNISSPTFSDVTISGNSAVSGGGMYNSRGNVSLVGVTISGNTATSGSGGGMFNYFSNPTLSNVTISGNFAQTGRGGAMLNMDQSFPALTNVTLNGNIAAIDGGGITNLDDSTVILRNVILWGNTGGHLFNDSTSSAVITNSVVEDGCPSGSACTNLITTNPMLGMLGDHGGETETVPLLAGSSAVDAAIANCPAEDQRGVARSAPNCDIGAYEYSSDNAAPSVVSVSLDSSYVNGPNSFTITFSEALYDPSGDMSSDDVSNPENYLLVESGVDGVFNTVSCAGGWASDDQRVNIAGVAYDNRSFTTTITLSGAVPNGSYRLFVCGTTSISDLALNPINGGLSDYTTDFTVSDEVPASTAIEAQELPETGFVPGRRAVIPAQPVEKVYASTNMRLEIPALGVDSVIMSVPQTGDGWDVTWLGDYIGYLNGSAFPTWTGNTVLTGHVWNANNQPGIFEGLKSLQYGDRVKIHAWGLTYTYEVRETDQVGAEDVRQVMRHETLDWITLVTCEDYQSARGEYAGRRIVRAVLISVE